MILHPLTGKEIKFNDYRTSRKWPGVLTPNRWWGPLDEQDAILNKMHAYMDTQGRKDPNNNEMTPDARGLQVRGEWAAHEEWGITGYLDEKNWRCFDGGRDVLDADVKTVKYQFCPLLMWPVKRKWENCTAKRMVLATWDKPNNKVALVGECPKGDLQRAAIYTHVNGEVLKCPCHLLPWYELIRPVRRKMTPRYSQMALLEG